jgi:hypothetical protein
VDLEKSMCLNNASIGLCRSMSYQNNSRNGPKKDALVIDFWSQDFTQFTEILFDNRQHNLENKCNGEILGIELWRILNSLSNNYPHP